MTARTERIADVLLAVAIGIALAWLAIEWMTA